MHAEPLGLFEEAMTARDLRPRPFSPFPLTTKRRLAQPTHISRIPRGTDLSIALDGAALHGFDMFRQGEEVAALLEASKSDGSPLYETVAILLPRRATKTTSVWSTILGRAKNIPGFKAVTTAQDGIRARNRFRDVQRSLQAQDLEGQKNPNRRLGKLRWANGDEAIEFDNGSRIWVVPPESGAFRSEAADLLFFDEAGELSATRSEDLVGGALPLMDTRPRGQVIIAGTPGLTRSGMLWTFVERGRSTDRADRSVGVLDYSLRDGEHSTTVDDDGVHHLNIKALRRVHPGIGTLTTTARIQSRFEAMQLTQFEREYFCRFPFDATISAIPAADWQRARRPFEELPPRPDHVGLAFDVEPDSSSAALVAAWRDETGRVHLEVLACRPGTAWLTVAGRDASRKHRAPITHDIIGANMDPANLLHRARVSLDGQQLRAVQGAAARIVQELAESNVSHYSQSDLDHAVEGVNWRNVGDGGRLFGRKASANPVSPIVAASLALWAYDNTGPRRAPVIVTSAAMR